MTLAESHDPAPSETPLVIEAISAVTLATHDMERALRFYLALGFTLAHWILFVFQSVSSTRMDVSITKEFIISVLGSRGPT